MTFNLIYFLVQAIFVIGLGFIISFPIVMIYYLFKIRKIKKNIPEKLKGGDIIDGKEGREYRTDIEKIRGVGEETKGEGINRGNEQGNGEQRHQNYRTEELFRGGYNKSTREIQWAF